MLVSAHGLRQLGKEVYLYNPDPVPRRLAWLPGAQDCGAKYRVAFVLMQR